MSNLYLDEKKLPSKHFICFGKLQPIMYSRKFAISCVRHASYSSKLSTILDGELPQIFNHIKEQNRTNSLSLKVKYDALMSRALAGGGERGIERHVKRNKKMLVRDRIKLLLDEHSSVLELSPLAGLDMEYGDVPGAGVVTLIGKVHGILSMVIANDATVKSGSVYPITLKKQLRAQKIAEENRLPCIYLVDSGGAFLPKQDEIFIEGGKTFFNQAMMSSEGIPQMAFVCGSCTAGGAYIPAMADEAVILHKAGSIFLGGPPLVYAATGERVTAEQLGGATLHCKTSGVTDHFANTEEEGLQLTRDVIATLNLHDLTCGHLEFDEPLHSPEHLNEMAPSRDEGYQVEAHFQLACLLDGSRFHEFKATFGPSLLAGFGFVKGRLAGFLVSNGHMTGPAYVKATHFVQLCSQRGTPMVFLQNFNRADSLTLENEKFNQQRATLIKLQAQLMQAIACANVPAVAIATGGVIGSLESHALGSLAMGSRFQFVYPNARVGGLHPCDLAHSAAEQEDQDTEKTGSVLSESFNDRKRHLHDKFQVETDAFYAATRQLNDGVILPADTREVIASCLEIFDQESRLRAHLANIKVTQPMVRL